MSARIALIMASIFCLSACASLPETQDRPSKSQTTNGLDARVLTSGECGLFVWSADEKKTFILYGQSQQARASWLSPTGEMTLKVISQSGAPTQGQYPQQSLSAQVIGTLALNLRGAQPIESGTRYRLGTLTQRGAEGGDDRVTPVVGLSACKPAAR